MIRPSTPKAGTSSSNAITPNHETHFVGFQSPVLQFSRNMQLLNNQNRSTQNGNSRLSSPILHGQMSGYTEFGDAQRELGLGSPVVHRQMSGYTDSGDIQRGNVGPNTSNIHQQLPNVAVYGGAQRDGAGPGTFVEHQQASGHADTGGARQKEGVPATSVGYLHTPYREDVEYESESADPTQESYMETLIKKKSGTIGHNPKSNMQQWQSR